MKGYSLPYSHRKSRTQNGFIQHFKIPKILAVLLALILKLEVGLVSRCDSVQDKNIKYKNKIQNIKYKLKIKNNQNCFWEGPEQTVLYKFELFESGGDIFQGIHKTDCVPKVCHNSSQAIIHLFEYLLQKIICSFQMQMLLMLNTH